jgi:hypothetical protein
VVSVDTKKKELIGDFKNAGCEWHPMGHPVEVRTKDFVDKQRGKGIPYGVYDLTANTDWVSVGLDHDTAQIAAESLRRWWQQMGARVYPKAEELLVTADAGGSNGYRIRLGKVALQELADAIGLRISVCHVPPGTSKWNKIEREPSELRSRSSSWLAMAAPGGRVSAGITRVLVGEGNKEHRHDEQGDNQFSVVHQSSSFCEAIEMRGGSAGRPIPRLSYTCWNGGRDRSLLMDSTILHTKRSRSPIPSCRQDRCPAKVCEGCIVS